LDNELLDAYVFVASADAAALEAAAELVRSEGPARFLAPTVGEHVAVLAIRAGSLEEIEGTLDQLRAGGITHFDVGIAAGWPPFIPQPPRPMTKEKQAHFALVLAEVSAEETEEYLRTATELTDTMTTLVGARSRVLLELAGDSFDEVVDAGVRLQSMTNNGTTGTLFASRDRLVIGPTEG
jgi:hypothetical protein